MRYAPWMPIKESQIQRAILEYLARIGRGFFWRNQSTGLYDPTKKTFRAMAFGQVAGVPDILGVFEGRFVGIEVKTPIGKVSPNQKIFMEKAKANGAVVFIARSIEDVKNGLESGFPGIILP